MKIAICDDLPVQIERIYNATSQYFKGCQEVYTIDTFSKAFDFLNIQAKDNFDLVLLDICMPGILGTHVAKEIRMRNDKTEIIFLTTSNDFAIDAFELNAAHYLLKPFTQDQFEKAMNRALQNIKRKEKKMTFLKLPKGIIHAVETNTIIYIEAAAHRQFVILNDGLVIETAQTLAELYNAVQVANEDVFITPYKGYIVNQHAISRIESDKIILNNGKKIPIPRRSFKRIKETYFNYMFKGK